MGIQNQELSKQPESTPLSGRSKPSADYDALDPLTIQAQWKTKYILIFNIDFN